MARTRFLGYLIAAIAAALVVFKYGWMATVYIGPPIAWVLFGCFGVVALGVSIGSLPLTRDDHEFSFALDIPFFIFFSVMLLSTLVGLARGFDQLDVFAEVMALALYGSYWLVSRFVKPGVWFGKIMLLSILFASLVVMAEFIYIYKVYLIPRVMTQQANITAAGFFAGLNYLVLSKNKRMWVKLVVALATVAALFTVIAAMQRTVWVGLALILPLNLIFLRIKGYISNKALWLSFAGLVLGSALILLVLWFSPMRWLIELFFMRFTTLQRGFGDASLNLRYIDAQNALKLFWASPVMGQGIGCPIWIRWSKEMSRVMDNSYLVFLWKTGIMGTLAFLGFYLSGLFIALKRFFKTTDRTRAFIYISVAGMLAVALISGFTCSILYAYRFIFIYGAAMGALALIEEPRSKP